MTIESGSGLLAEQDTPRNWPLRTEAEIIADWKGDISKPVVSVCCTTYNHELYIAEAISSILAQETDFPFEILIHDDASIDNTCEIVKKFEMYFPNLVRPIYQSENQYKKGVNINFSFNVPRANGFYIAFCEGDDFWVDAKKLQKQFNFLSSHPDVSFVGGLCQSFDDLTKESIQIFPKLGNIESILEIKDVDIFKMVHFVHVSTFMFKKVLVQKRNEIFKKFIVSGDLIILITASIMDGKIMVLNRLMSTYRMHNGGSWNAVVNKDRYKSYVNTWTEILNAIKFHYPENKKLISISKNNLSYYLIKNNNINLHEYFNIDGLVAAYRFIFGGIYRIQRDLINSNVIQGFLFFKK